MTEETAPCVLCGSTEFSFPVTAYDRMEARREDYQYCKCSSCGLVSLAPLPGQEEVLGFYPEDYPPHLALEQSQPDKLVNRLAIKYFYGVHSVSGPVCCGPSFASCPAGS